MSLILEALRKLERDKPAPDRGVVVMMAGGHSGKRGRAPGWVWLVLGIAGGLFTALAVLEWRRPEGVPGSATTASVPPARVAPTSLPPPKQVPPAAATSTRINALGPAAPASTAPAMAAPSAVSPPTSATPAAPDTPPASALTLHAITVQDGQPVALINDRVLREGDEIDGVRVLHIGEAEVEIERDGRRVVLRF